MDLTTFSIYGPLTEADDSAARTELLFDYMRRRGQGRYDEAVTQLEHALQAADLARAAGADDALTVGALLHDFGHFLQEEDEAHKRFQIEDLLHESVAADFLAPFFPQAVTDPIRHHVNAKRYLCTTDPAYHEELSPASQRSFVLQGGAMNDEERARFETIPDFERVLLARRWDDEAKVASKRVPDLEAYRDIVTAAWTVVN